MIIDKDSGFKISSPCMTDIFCYRVNAKKQTPPKLMSTGKLAWSRKIPRHNIKISCLDITLKILTTQIREKIYYSYECRELISRWKKQCHKQKKGTYDQLFIDQHILKNFKTKRKNVAKAYDMVPQNWNIELFKIYKISDKVINFITKAKENWKVELAAWRENIAEVTIQRNIFQGDLI